MTKTLKINKPAASDTANTRKPVRGRNRNNHVAPTPVPAAKPRGANSSKPQRSSDDKPRRDFSDRPPRRDSDKPRDSADRPRRDFSDKPKRDFGDRAPRRDASDKPRRDFGDRPPRRDGDKPRNFSDRPRRDFGEKPRDASDRPRRDFNDQPKRELGDRPPPVAMVKNLQRHTANHATPVIAHVVTSATKQNVTLATDLHDATTINLTILTAGLPHLTENLGMQPPTVVQHAALTTNPAK